MRAHKNTSSSIHLYIWCTCWEMARWIERTYVPVGARMKLSYEFSKMVSLGCSWLEKEPAIGRFQCRKVCDQRKLYSCAVFNWFELNVSNKFQSTSRRLEVIRIGGFRLNGTRDKFSRDNKWMIDSVLCNRPASFGGTLGNDMFVHCICNTPFGTRIKSNQTNEQKQNFLSFSKWLAVVRDTTITMVSLLQLPRCTGWYQHWWLQWLQFYHRFIFDLRSTMWMHQVLPWNNMFDAVQKKSHA